LQHVMYELPSIVLAPEARVVQRWGQAMQEQAPGPATLGNSQAPLTILFPGRTHVV
jgi:hypothetical protein